MRRQLIAALTMLLASGMAPAFADSDALREFIASHELLDQSMAGGQYGRAMVRPPGGVEVYERLRRDKYSGEELSRDRGWREQLAPDLEKVVEVNSFPGGQYRV